MIDATEETAVRLVVERHFDAIDRQDWEAFRGVFAAEAEFVTISGFIQRGADAIVKGHRWVWTHTEYSDSTVAASITVRLLAADVALARALATLSYNGGRDERTSTSLFVLTKSVGAWLIEVVQNTLIDGPPVTPVGNQPDGAT